MTGLPPATRVGKRLSKEAFFRAVPFSPAARKAFERGVESLVVLHSLTGRSLNLPDAPPASEILVLRVNLRGPLVPRCLEEIARANPHRLLFLLAQNGKVRPALFAGGALRMGTWTAGEDIGLRFSGLSLDGVWEGLVGQIVPLAASTRPLSERLAMHDRREALLRDLAREKRLARAEKEPRLKLAHHENALSIQRQLEDLDHGQD